MRTKTPSRKPSTWIDQARELIIGRRLLRKLKREGIVFELTNNRFDFRFWSDRTDAAGEPLDIPDETVRKINTNRSGLLAVLRHKEQSLDRITRIWLEHDPEYRAEYGDAGNE